MHHVPAASQHMLYLPQPAPRRLDTRQARPAPQLAMQRLLRTLSTRSPVMRSTPSAFNLSHVSTQLVRNTKPATDCSPWQQARQSPAAHHLPLAPEPPAAPPLPPPPAWPLPRAWQEPARAPAPCPPRSLLPPWPQPWCALAPLSRPWQPLRGPSHLGPAPLLRPQSEQQQRREGAPRSG